jgi:phytoene dehydrogenase-like protein
VRKERRGAQSRRLRACLSEAETTSRNPAREADMDLHDSEAAHYDVIVVGAGIAGAVCAATLTARGAHVLLISETVNPGHNVRSLPLDGHLACIQRPVWHMGGGGGHWARVVRELNLRVRVHGAPPVSVTARGSGRRARLPFMLSATALCDLVLLLIDVPREVLDYGEIQRVLSAGLLIPWDQLCQMHNVKLEAWLDDQKADQPSRLAVEVLAATAAGVPVTGIGQKLSVFGAFAHIRMHFAGEGVSSVIEPDIQRGLVLPLTDYVEDHGGMLWRGTKVQRVLLETGAVQGVRLADGRTATASEVALAVGNRRIPSFFAELPGELSEPLRNEPIFKHELMMIATLLTRPVVDVTDQLLIHDPSSGSNVWFIPLNVGTPWNSPDERQLCLHWWGGASGASTALVDNLDDLCEDEFPGWKSAITRRRLIHRRDDWLNHCYVGPKLPRRSPTIAGLWFVGESTEPVGGIALEQAAFAGYDGAKAISAAGRGMRRPT